MFSIKKFKALVSNKLSLVELSNVTNIDYSTLSRIFNGTTTNPHPDTIQALAKYFNVDISELYDNKLDMEIDAITNSKTVSFKNTQDLLKFLLINSGLLTTNALHIASGIPKANLDRIIKGSTEKPNITTLKMLSSYFNLTINQLLTYEPIIIEPDASLQRSKENKSYIPELTLLSAREFVRSHKLSHKSKILYSYKISSEAFMPDFDKNTILIADAGIIPIINKFIIASIKDDINIYEVHKEFPEILFLRKAGSEKIEQVCKKDFENLGVITQEIINHF